MVTKSSCSTDRWLSRSKVRMESTSSSHSSIRSGTSSVNGKISIIPPRMENCPMPSTWAILSYPMAVSLCLHTLRSMTCPLVTVMACSFRYCRGRRWSIRPSMVVTTTPPLSSIRCLNTAILCLVIRFPWMSAL